MKSEMETRLLCAQAAHAIADINDSANNARSAISASGIVQKIGLYDAWYFISAKYDLEFQSSNYVFLA